MRPAFLLSPHCRVLLAAIYARRCRAAMDAPRFARGMAAPASATAPPLTRRGAACAGGRPSSPRRHACGVHGWAPGGTRSLALARLAPRALPSAATRACALRAKRPACGAAANRSPSCRAGISAARFRAPKRGGLGTRAYIYFLSEFWRSKFITLCGKSSSHGPHR